MAKRNSGQEELNLDAVFKQIKAAVKSQKATPAGRKDVSKALTLFKKSQSFLNEAIALLEGDGGSGDENQSDEYKANAEKYPTAPFGRKLNGMPKLPSGKQVNTPEAESFRKQYPELVGGVAPAATAEPGTGKKGKKS